MPTAVVTPQIQAETAGCLTTLGISCYAWGGKYKTGFQTFQELMMTKLAEGISENPSSGNRRARKPRTAASTPSLVAEIDAPQRRRGRPPGQTKGARRPTSIDKPMTEQNVAILKCIAAGYSTPPLIIQELQKSYGITKRPNHMGIALGRLRDAGQIVTDGTAWTMTSLGRAAA